MLYLPPFCFLPVKEPPSPTFCIIPMHFWYFYKYVYFYKLYIYNLVFKSKKSKTIECIKCKILVK